jgi:hypothetical protein
MKSKRSIFNSSFLFLYEIILIIGFIFLRLISAPDVTLMFLYKRDGMIFRIDDNGGPYLVQLKVSEIRSASNVI